MNHDPANRRHTGPDYPAWLREIDHTLPATPQYLLTGNVRDVHLLPEGAPRWPELLSTADALVDLFIANGYRVVLYYDPVDQLSVLHEVEPGAAALIMPGMSPGQSRELSLNALGNLLRSVVENTDGRAAIILDYGSRLRSNGQDAPAPELHALLSRAQKLAYSAVAHAPTAVRSVALYNTLVWVMDREGDLPHWLAASDRVRVVSVPAPNLTARIDAGPRLIAGLPEFPHDDADRAGEVYRHFADFTHGMTLRSLREIATLATESRIPVTRLDEAVRSYRVGLTDNPWKQRAVIDRIREGYDLLSERVFGQSAAIRKSLDILMRSAVGLTGAQSGGHAHRPQGILFFAGPTGVGKTELAKSLADLLFGTEDAYVRFDMSEFSAEHSEARLIGAPPGYVGHDAGGELTNAVRQRPFSILLFDEIEKAHPRILDKFLQILEDGRLTDGSGSTVYFSETVIVFTSNLGIYREENGRRVPVVKPGEPYDSLVEKVRGAVADEFTSRIGRPELLNRIGDNIVVFDFISEEIGRLLVGKYLENIISRVDKQRGIELTVAPEVVTALSEAALSPEALAFGGRGIGSAIESAFINPLARAIFEADLSPGPATVIALDRAADGWRVRLG